MIGVPQKHTANGSDATITVYPGNWKVKVIDDTGMTVAEKDIKVEAGLKESGNKKVVIPTVFTAAPAVVEAFNKTPYAEKLKATGVVLSYICPLMYMNNPLCKSMPVITNSNKLRTYTTSRYYRSEEILDIITKEAK